MSDEVDEFCLTARRGRHRALSRELRHGNELLQSNFEDLGNFHKRVNVGNALQDLASGARVPRTTQTLLPAAAPTIA